MNHVAAHTFAMKLALFVIPTEKLEKKNLLVAAAAYFVRFAEDSGPAGSYVVS